MATFTIVADINQGDETTASENLVFKVYNDGVLYYTTGTATNDSDVTIVGTTVTITNVPVSGFETFNITVTAIDEAKNESGVSNELTVGVISFYAEGFYEPGFYQ